MAKIAVFLGCTLTLHSMHTSKHEWVGITYDDFQFNNKIFAPYSIIKNRGKLQFMW